MFPVLLGVRGKAKTQVAITVLARMPDDPEACRTLNSPEEACCSKWTTALIDSSNLAFNLSWCLHLVACACMQFGGVHVNRNAVRHAVCITDDTDARRNQPGETCAHKKGQRTELNRHLARGLTPVALLVTV